MLGLVSLSFLYVIVVVHCEGKWGQELKVGTCSVEWGWGSLFQAFRGKIFRKARRQFGQFGSTQFSWWWCCEGQP